MDPGQVRVGRGPGRRPVGLTRPANEVPSPGHPPPANYPTMVIDGFYRGDLGKRRNYTLGTAQLLSLDVYVFFFFLQIFVLLLE